MIDSNNIEIMRDNLKELDQKIENLDVEIPAHTSGDAGKYLGVDSSGDLEFSRPIPATTEADEGKVLTVNSSGVPAFETPLPGNKNYSETEIDTGYKWINGKPIYMRSFTGITPDTEGNFTFGVVSDIDELIHLYGSCGEAGHDERLHIFERTFSPLIYKTTGNIAAAIQASYVGVAYNVTVLYTKTDPEPSPENVTKKKKSK